MGKGICKATPVLLHRGEMLLASLCDMFDKKEYQDQEGNLQTSQAMSELPNTGSQHQEIALKSEQRTSIRSLKCETADGSERSNRSTSKQNSQKQTKPDELETRHSFQRWNSGKPAAPDTALWVAQRLMEEKPERAGIPGEFGQHYHPLYT
jgi:hypothetical protein